MVGPAGCGKAPDALTKWLGEITLQPSLNTSLVTARMILQLDGVTRSQSLDR